MKRFMNLLMVVLLGIVLVACDGKKVNPKVTETKVDYSILNQEQFYSKIIVDDGTFSESTEFTGKEKGIIAKALRIAYDGYDIGKMVAAADIGYEEPHKIVITYNKLEGSISFNWKNASIVLPFTTQEGEPEILTMTASDVEVFESVRKKMTDKYGKTEANEIMQNVYEQSYEPKFYMAGDRVSARDFGETANIIFEEYDIKPEDIKGFDFTAVINKDNYDEPLVSDGKDGYTLENVDKIASMETTEEYFGYVSDIRVNPTMFNEEAKAIFQEYDSQIINIGGVNTELSELVDSIGYKMSARKMSFFITDGPSGDFILEIVYYSVDDIEMGTLALAFDSNSNLYIKNSTFTKDNIHYLRGVDILRATR